MAMTAVTWLGLVGVAVAAPPTPPAATLADIDVLRDRLIAFYTDL